MPYFSLCFQTPESSEAAFLLYLNLDSNLNCITSLYVCACVRACMPISHSVVCVCMYVCVCVCVLVNVSICKYVCVYIHVCVCMCVYMCVCMCVSQKEEFLTNKFYTPTLLLIQRITGMWLNSLNFTVHVVSTISTL